ncbi:MAG: hypothetical protein JSU94_02205 [Phycisphaerales bacterium]|nr:MAG: hypothetical protein JSU94_02205 [Phycisphaerales bacterium]
MDQWEINKPLGQCSGSGKVIEPGQEYFGALVQTEEGLQRRDFSADYWEKEKPEVYCFWKTRLPHPEQKKQIFVDDEMLMAFFERLAAETERQRLEFRFVLGLILMRKRLLKYDSKRTEDGAEIWRLRVTGGREMIDVLNPDLDEEQIARLSSQIGQILQADI